LAKKKLGLDWANHLGVMYIDDASEVVQTLQRIASRLVMTNLDKTFSIFKKEMWFSYLSKSFLCTKPS
jgi:hypothetical protein